VIVPQKSPNTERAVETISMRGHTAHFGQHVGGQGIRLVLHDAPGFVAQALFPLRQPFVVDGAVK